MSSIRTAVFPVAGLGTRFLPATKAIAKEMLTVVDKPLIQYATEEAVAAGMDTLVFVVGRTKNAIIDHYDKAYELETELSLRDKKTLLKAMYTIKQGRAETDSYAFNIETLIILLRDIEQKFKDTEQAVDQELEVDKLPAEMQELRDQMENMDKA